MSILWNLLIYKLLKSFSSILYELIFKDAIILSKWKLSFPSFTRQHWNHNLKTKQKNSKDLRFNSNLDSLIYTLLPFSSSFLSHSKSLNRLLTFDSFILNTGKFVFVLRDQINISKKFMNFYIKYMDNSLLI